MKHIVIRHDVVHRGGKTKDGSGIVITVAKLNQLRTDVVAFLDEVEAHLKRRFPENSMAGLGQVDEF